MLDNELLRGDTGYLTHRERALLEAGLETARFCREVSGLDQLLRGVASRIARALEVPYSEILELSVHRGAFVLSAGEGFPQDLVGRASLDIHPLRSHAACTLLTDDVLVVEDFRQHYHRFEVSELFAAHGIRAAASTGVRVAGESWGVLGAMDTRPRGFDAAERRYLEEAASALGAAIERIRLIAEGMEVRAHAEFLCDVHKAIDASRSPEEAAEEVARLAVSPRPGLPGGRFAEWVMIDKEEIDASGGRPRYRLRRLAARTAQGNGSPELHDVISDPPHLTTTAGPGSVLATGRPELQEKVDDRYKDAIARSTDHRRAIEEMNPVSYMGVPMRLARSVTGAVSFVSTREDRPYGGRFLDTASAVGVALALLCAAAPDAGSFPRPLSAGDGFPSGDEEPGTPRPYVRPSSRQVFDLLAEGWRIPRICSTLHISKSTYHSHINYLKDIFGVQTPEELRALARRIGKLSG
jgi:hypothetical protein